MIPAGNFDNPSYWEKLSSINWKELFYSSDNRGVNLLLHLKELIKKDLKPDFILIDSRTGITDISGIAMTLLSDKVVTLAANNIENLIGTRNVMKSLLNRENSLSPNRIKLYFVLSRIPYYNSAEKKHIEAKIVSDAISYINEKGEIVDKAFVIHSDRELEEEEKFKINNTSSNLKTENSVPIEEDYLSLFEELTKGDLSGDEVQKFNNLREYSLLVEEAKSTEDNAIKIRLLKKALELNKNSHEVYCLLAITYNRLEQFEKSIESIKRAIEIDEFNSNYKWILSLNFKELNKFEEAKNLLFKIIEEDKDYHFAFGTLGHIFYEEEEFEKSLEYHLKYLEYASSSAHALNSVGNGYRAIGDFENAFKYTYKCLEIDPKHKYGTSTLAEIYAEKGNKNEFYKNLQLSFVFGMTSKEFQQIINLEKVYHGFKNEDRFMEILRDYRIKVSFPS